MHSVLFFSLLCNLIASSVVFAFLLICPRSYFTDIQQETSARSLVEDFIDPSDGKLTRQSSSRVELQKNKNNRQYTHTRWIKTYFTIIRYIFIRYYLNKCFTLSWI